MAVPHTDFSVGGSGGGDSAFSSYSSREIEPKSSQYENKKLTVKEEEKTTTFESSSGHCGGELVRIKDEEEEEEEEEDEVEVEVEEDEGGAVDDGAVDGGSLPKPMEGLNDVGPPPFLRKLYEMVEDPGTDPIVSWSLNRNSFTVWDSHDFSENLLPKHFKHKNFSSFIRQLNTYGFKKVHSDRWEFANEMFQGGKRYLLKNIKRRNRFNNKPQDVTITWVDPTVELETLRNDQNALKLEILKLKQQQDHAASQMRAAAERIRCAECKQQQMLNFLAKIAKCPNYVQQLIRSRKQPRGISGAAELDYSDSKKRRYIETESAQGAPHQISLPVQYGGENVNCRKQAQEKLASMQSELTDMLPPGSNTSIVDHHTMDKPPFQALMDDDDDGTSGRRQNLAAVYNNVVGNLLGDSSVVDAKTDGGYVDEDQVLSVNDTPLFHELEDLIAKPRSWRGYVNDLVEQVGCVGSMY